MPAWKALFAKVMPRPARILEIGAFEGRSTCFMLEHILPGDLDGAPRPMCATHGRQTIPHVAFPVCRAWRHSLPVRVLTALGRIVSIEAQ